MQAEDAPPVPPKDSPYKSSRMDMDRPPTAPASASKRKREAYDETIYDLRNGRLEVAADPDAHTPKKRSRSRLSQAPSDSGVSDDDMPLGQRSVRRKRAVGNLSNLSLRHAAAQQQSLPSPNRESRFQEGSLTDKPSEQPPSVFTRMTHSESGNLEYVDELMADYHNGSQEEVPIQDAGSVGTAATAGTKATSSGLSRFGRSFASNFYPLNLWNRMWNETKEELTKQNILEAERKTRQKTEAETQYAQMKSEGQFGFSLARNDVASARDSGVDSGSERPSQQHHRVGSYGSQLALPHDDRTDHSGSEVHETGYKGQRSIRSRLHFKRPSLSNIKNEIKRVASIPNLTAGGSHRDSSSSVSPVKASFTESGLPRSHSKFELKKQHRLSKRVSDLETKLQRARQELDEALVQASPMPKLGNRYERFTPTNAMRRPRFVPGGLPTLPSERLLFPELMGFNGEGEDVEGGEDAEDGATRKSTRDGETTHVGDPTHDGADDDATIKVPRGRQYPMRASSLFNLNDHLEQPLEPEENNDIVIENDTTRQSSAVLAAQPKQTTSDNTEITKMDPNDVAAHRRDDDTGRQSSAAAPSKQTTSDATKVPKMVPNNITAYRSEDRSDDRSDDRSEGASEQVADTGYDALNAKLKAIEAPAKASKKSTKSKKRTAAKSFDKDFKPGGEGDDDAEWEEATPKKKRKSAGNSQISPQDKPTPRSKASKKKAAALEVFPPTKKVTRKAAALSNALKSEDVEMTGAGAAQGETADETAAPGRTSIDSQHLSLEPVYEEEEETSLVPVKDAPAKPTARATPARYGRNDLRSRSNSPHKRAQAPVQLGAEETLITRAAAAAKNGRRPRSVSPPPPTGRPFSALAALDETVSIVPGEGDVPKLPKGAMGSYESLEEVQKEGKVLKRQTKTTFEWPEDVF